jgi:hypothetical protein
VVAVVVLAREPVTPAVLVTLVILVVCPGGLAVTAVLADPFVAVKASHSWLVRGGEVAMFVNATANPRGRRCRP